MSSSIIRESPKLHNLAKKKSIDTILELFLSEETGREEPLEKFRQQFICNTPLAFKEQIILESIPLLIKYRKDCFPEILKFFLSDKEVHRNLIIYIDENNFTEIIHLIEPHAEGFNNLKLSLKNLSIDKIISLFALNYLNLETLQLIIDVNLDFKILGTILKSCPLLKQLNIFNSKEKKFLHQIGDEDYMQVHLNLRKFEYVENSVPLVLHKRPKNTLDIFESKLPNLKILDLPKYLFNSFVNLISLNLSEITLYEISLDKIKLVIDASSNLESLRLIRPKKGVFKYVMNSEKVKKLHLTVVCVKEINDLAGISEPQKLVSLTIKFVKSVDLNFILNSYPNLQSLHVAYNKLVFAQNTVTYYDQIKEFSYVGARQENLNFLLEGFRNIECLKINSLKSNENIIINENLIPFWQKLQNLIVNFEILLLNKDFLLNVAQSCPKLETIENLFDKYQDDTDQMNEIREILKVTSCNVSVIQNLIHI